MPGIVEAKFDPEALAEGCWIDRLGERVPGVPA